MKRITESELTSGQAAKLEQFKKANRGKNIEIVWFPGDSRNVWRQHGNDPEWCKLGCSNGCATSRNNYHSTWAHVIA